MKKIYFLKAIIILFLCVSMNGVMQAQNFKLIDVNKIKNSNPSNQSFLGKMFAELNGIFYFQADDGINGIELYRSDGTAEGTRLVKDINPGASSSSCSKIKSFPTYLINKEI